MAHQIRQVPCEAVGERRRKESCCRRPSPRQSGYEALVLLLDESRRTLGTAPTFIAATYPPSYHELITPLTCCVWKCLQVSIIEKAYMKVHGGYDFPGSNSGIDLYALTGWIPESIQFDPSTTDSTQYERTWSRLLSASHFGDCLITISTGPMDKAEVSGDFTSKMSPPPCSLLPIDLFDTYLQEAALGLVESHAYAVLDVKEAGGVRLLKVNSPSRLFVVVAFRRSLLTQPRGLLGEESVEQNVLERPVFFVRLSELDSVARARASIRSGTANIITISSLYPPAAAEHF